MKDTTSREIGKRRNRGLNNIRTLTLRALAVGASMTWLGRSLKQDTVRAFANGADNLDANGVRRVRKWAHDALELYEKDSVKDLEAVVSLGETPDGNVYGVPTVEIDSPIPGAMEDAEHIQRKKKQVLLNIMETGVNTEKIQAMKLLGEMSSVDLENETPEEVQKRIDSVRAEKVKCEGDIEKIETLVSDRNAEAALALETKNQGVQLGGDETPSPEGRQVTGEAQGGNSPETPPPDGEAVPPGEVHSGLCPVPSGDDKSPDDLQPVGVRSPEGPREDNS